MKKILSTLLILLFSLALASCERDNQKEDVFYNARNTKIVGDIYETFYQVMLNYKAAGYLEFDTNLPILF